MSNMSKTIAILGVVAGLGVAALPLSTYAAPTPIEGTGTPLKATKDVPVQLKIKETLNMYVTNEAGDADFTSPVTIGTGEISAADIYESQPIAVKVETANKDGYQLTLAGSYTKEGQTDVKSFLVNENNTKIASGDLTSTTDSQWGYKVLKGAAGSTLDATWNTVTDTAKNIDGLTEAGVLTTKVTFGASIVAGQQGGTYDGQVTLTATAGPAA